VCEVLAFHEGDGGEEVNNRGGPFTSNTRACSFESNTHTRASVSLFTYVPIFIASHRAG
jgi:hypothetical protein